MMELPKSALQFIDPLRYQRVAIAHNLAMPMRFGVVFADSFSQISNDLLGEPAAAHILIWNTKDTGAILTLLKVSDRVIIWPNGDEIADLLLSSGLPRAKLVRGHSAMLAHLKASATKALKVSKKKLDKQMTAASELAAGFFINSEARTYLPFAPLRVNLAHLHKDRA
jgi:hypothetical protein